MGNPHLQYGEQYACRPQGPDGGGATPEVDRSGHGARVDHRTRRTKEKRTEISVEITCCCLAYRRRRVLLLGTFLGFFSFGGIFSRDISRRSK